MSNTKSKPKPYSIEWFFVAPFTDSLNDEISASWCQVIYDLLGDVPKDELDKILLSFDRFYKVNYDSIFIQTYNRVMGFKTIHVKRQAAEDITQDLMKHLMINWEKVYNQGEDATSYIATILGNEFKRFARRYAVIYVPDTKEVYDTSVTQPRAPIESGLSRLCDGSLVGEFFSIKSDDSSGRDDYYPVGVGDLELSDYSISMTGFDENPLNSIIRCACDEQYLSALSKLEGHNKAQWEVYTRINSGCRHKDVAEELNISVSSSQKHLERAVAYLKERLKLK